MFVTVAPSGERVTVHTSRDEAERYARMMGGTVTEE